MRIFIILNLPMNCIMKLNLVFRVSKNGKYIPEYAASRYYNAITVGIDFTARDVQQELKKKGLPWEKAKAWDNSAVAGDWIDLTPEMLKNPIRVFIDTQWRNGTKR